MFQSPEPSLTSTPDPAAALLPSAVQVRNVAFTLLSFAIVILLLQFMQRC